jgi:putative endonuclease
MKQPCVYILASQPHGTLYTGVTSDLVQRVWQHKQHLVAGFTQRYAVSLLVWYEVHEEMQCAIQRERRIKEWRRQWKIELVEAVKGRLPVSAHCHRAKHTTYRLSLSSPR